MAFKRGTKKPAKTISLLEVQSGSDLSVRLEKISGQTGLSPMSLLQKWILQEETLIGLMQRNKGPMAEQAETSPDNDPKRNLDSKKKMSKAIPSGYGSSNNREKLVKMASKLKKSGMALKKIAETFNEEKIPTISGVGKWYPGSINNLLKSKK